MRKNGQYPTARSFFVIFSQFASDYRFVRLSIFQKPVYSLPHYKIPKSQAVMHLSYIFIQFTNSPCIIGDTLHLFQIHFLFLYQPFYSYCFFLSFPPACINANICSFREMNALYHTPLRIAKDYLPFSKNVLFFFLQFRQRG